jgi:predicted dinucleotide-binding enzyme
VLLAVHHTAPAELGSCSRLSVLFAADDAGAGELVTDLITDVGHRAVAVGGLDRARYLESAAALVISLLSRGEPRGSLLNWTRVSKVTASGCGTEASS